MRLSSWYLFSCDFLLKSDIARLSHHGTLFSCDFLLQSDIVRLSSWYLFSCDFLLKSDIARLSHHGTLFSCDFLLQSDISRLSHHDTLFSCDFLLQSDILRDTYQLITVDVHCNILPKTHIWVLSWYSSDFQHFSHVAEILNNYSPKLLLIMFLSWDLIAWMYHLVCWVCGQIVGLWTVRILCHTSHSPTFSLTLRLLVWLGGSLTVTVA